MKKFFTFFSLLLIASAGVKAQTTYFTEYFDNGATAITGTTTSAATTPTIATIGTGDWTVYYAFRAGSGCMPNDPAVSSAKGLRVLQTSATSPAGLSTNANGPDAYIVTPTLGFGVNVVSWKNASQSLTSRISIYKSHDNGAGWILVQQNIDGTGAACGDYSVTVNDAAANKIKFQNESTTGVDLDNITITSTSTIVPVTFGGINAIVSNGSVKVNFSILSELNTKEYIVERSDDGKQFSAIGTLTAKGASNYTWIDNAPVAGTGYYKIEAVDNGGSINYSTIVTASTTGSNAAAIVVNPNPVIGGHFTLQLNNLAQGDYALTVTSTGGQSILSSVISHPGGSSSRTITLPSVAKGLYNVHVGNLNKTIVVE